MDGFAQKCTERPRKREKRGALKQRKKEKVTPKCTLALYGDGKYKTNPPKKPISDKSNETI